MNVRWSLLFFCVCLRDVISFFFCTQNMASGLRNAICVLQPSCSLLWDRGHVPTKRELVRCIAIDFMFYPRLSVLIFEIVLFLFGMHTVYMDCVSIYPRFVLQLYMHMYCVRVS